MEKVCAVSNGITRQFGKWDCRIWERKGCFMKKSAKIAFIGRRCVACGCCMQVCPRGAIHIESGTIARIDEEKCVGCGKCAGSCPAAVITIGERRAEQ